MRAYRLAPKRATPWYAEYEGLRRKVEATRLRFLEQCRVLAVDPAEPTAEFSRELIIRAVHESNWQEGIYLDEPRTQEFAEIAFERSRCTDGPRLDMNTLLDGHRRDVAGLKRKRASIDEIAAFNLSRAHLALAWIGAELATRQAASLAYALRGFEELYPKLREQLSPEARQRIERGFDLIRGLCAETAPVGLPLDISPATQGDLLQKLLSLDFEDLLNPMCIDYVHFLHQLTMMGTLPSPKRGCFRKSHVHVGNPNVFFPPPSLVPSLMERFCKDYPSVLSNVTKYDPILKAAEVSHEFVRIHPYVDGNGRVSRLLANLILRQHHYPIAVLKADKKGRHRYAQALHRADRDDFKPLASLIAVSIASSYERLLQMVT